MVNENKLDREKNLEDEQIQMCKENIKRENYKIINFKIT